MERILEKWQHKLYAGFGTYPKSKRSLLISLIVAIVGLVSTIYILSLPEYIPGT
ncbi:hypothetical protein SDC49_19595 [Lactobacillus sp. R2/2]|nr:hypothetical protein [Lactobacillus sp. R2/2]